MSKLGERDLAVFWHPASQMRDYHDFPPLEVVSAHGCRLQLADGRIILDAISSWWCKTLGHGHAGVRAALEAQLRTFEHVIAAGTTNEPLVSLCERLLSMANGLPPATWGAQAPAGRQPGHFGKVFLADNGSTGVEIALKMALQAQAQRGKPGRNRFAALANGYHGETVGALSVGDLDLYGGHFQALTFPVEKIRDLPYRSGPEDPRWLNVDEEWPRIRAQLDTVATSLAAIIYEPVLQAAGGMRLYSPALLPRLRSWADDNDVYLIADEIAAGMGRLGTMLATRLAPEVALPDLLVLSKGLTAGFLPLSAVLTTDAIYALFDGDSPASAFLHSNTWTGNALGVAAALASLDAYADGDGALLATVGARGAILQEQVRALAAARPYLRQRRGAGMMAAIDLARPDGQPYDPRLRTGRRVYRQAVTRGALLRPLGDTLYLFPPLDTSPEDLRAMVAVLGESIDATAE